ncbi:hypothetical protein ATO3_00645 [Marinibacterium profundimaris]|uniref:FAD-dependent urate hydroxylase HpyO/Asp monooxygenase CreE-like FAD/NAD(P)-binding domain-containing protein n=2 Tax=Marinibacterium profundimaris TaxID=1679460 RepID=A0A225NQQ1_9RHOB|nr:hypothetical protein ATO3_00645 [Marinibacterium profundimaris]
MGPRGLGALEALADARAGQPALKVDIFDAFPAPGAGPNFDPAESPLCRLNIPMRDIAIRPPAFSALGPFADWPDAPADPDAFPPRAELGRYLEARFAELRAHAALAISLRPHAVTDLKRDDTGWQLFSDDSWHGPYAEVLLVPGQPKVAPDDQLAEWQDHAGTGAGRLAQAYPARLLQDRAVDWAGQTVAIRGLALSSFDVLRVLTTGQGGRFADGTYVASGGEPARILPFSLDGRPPAPKPATAALDACFAPTQAESDAFAEAIAAAATADPDTARQKIDGALLPPVRRILEETGTDPAGVADWLATEWDAPGTQEDSSPLQALQDGLAMAEGRQPPSIGYTVGQVWRTWQDALRIGYNPATTPPDTAEALVGFDEGLKRYSYGPPVSSCHELAALIEAGIVSLELATDPEITLIPEGWRLACGDTAIEASVMVDGVLPNPDLGAVRDPLVTGLLDDGWLTAREGPLAADTAGDGALIGPDGATAPGLCLLGRMSLGSVIAADSLHDCFGAASRRWARGVTDRIGQPQG